MNQLNLIERGANAKLLAFDHNIVKISEKRLYYYEVSEIPLGISSVYAYSSLSITKVVLFNTLATKF